MSNAIHSHINIPMKMSTVVQLLLYTTGCDLCGIASRKGSNILLVAYICCRRGPHFPPTTSEPTVQHVAVAVPISYQPSWSLFPSNHFGTYLKCFSFYWHFNAYIIVSLIINAASELMCITSVFRFTHVNI